MKDDEFEAEITRAEVEARSKLNAAVPGAIAMLRNMAKNAKSAEVRAQAKRDLERLGIPIEDPEIPDGK